MKSHRSVTRCLLVLGVLTVLMAGSFRARAADSGTVAPGTKITKQNWQQYKQFMAAPLQYLFGDKYFYKMPADVVLEVGPTIPVKLPAKWFQDTEKYAGQVKLRKLDNGGYLIDNYVAGLPFPKLDPSDPLIGYKIMYNAWYTYRPMIAHGQIANCVIDRYQNATANIGDEINYRLMHISNPNEPTNYPAAHGIFTVGNFYLLAPEQSKYTTSLTLVPDDLMKQQENYVFLPSLRRSLRLSSAARCAPLLGSDYTPDDIGFFNVQVANFSVDYMGEHKYLAIAHANPSAMLKSWSYQALTEWDEPPLMFPTPKVGKFEVRDFYVVDLKPLASYANGYCYGRRIMYVDKETNLVMWVELYDQNKKLWKFGYNFGSTIRVPTGGEQMTNQAGAWNALYDIQNYHSNAAGPTMLTTYNSDTPKDTQNIDLHASPGGLDQIMK
jgi:Protein of unknown function (DUF1329)